MICRLGKGEKRCSESAWRPGVDARRSGAHVLTSRGAGVGARDQRRKPLHPSCHGPMVENQ